MELDFNKLKLSADYSENRKTNAVGDGRTINDVFQQLLNNDLEIYGNFEKIPGIWECKWYNDDRIEGYAKGDFFWLNTEDLEQFLKTNANKIKEYTDVNPFVKEKLPVYKGGDTVVFDQYVNALTGYIAKDNNSKRLSALYEIGYLSACTQLIVSQCDNNKYPITDKNHWKKFFIDDEDKIALNSIVLTNITKTLVNHINLYHFGGMEPTAENKEELKTFINKDFSLDTLSNLHVLANNYLNSKQEKSTGLNSVRYYIKCPVIRNTSAEIKNIAENRWFRLWRSGFLEHGGTLNTNYLFVNNDRTKIRIPLQWKYTQYGAKNYQIKYIGIETQDKRIIADSIENSAIDALSVLFELPESNFSILNSNLSQIYTKNDYMIHITPYYILNTNPEATDGANPIVSYTTAYENLGNFSPEMNSLNSCYNISTKQPQYFEMSYNSENIPSYISYYCTGYLFEKDTTDEEDDDIINM